MHGLVDAQPLDVRPVEEMSALLWHLFSVQERREGDVLRTRCRFGPLEEIAQREADPGDHHRPCLDAAHAIDTLLEWKPPEEHVDVDDLRSVDLTPDGHRPGAGSQRACAVGWVALVGPELV